MFAQFYRHYILVPMSQSVPTPIQSNPAPLSCQTPLVVVELLADSSKGLRKFSEAIARKMTIKTIIIIFTVVRMI